MPNKQESMYKAHYNPKRECYISSDGKHLCYIATDLNTHRPVTLRYEIGKDGITEDLTFLIDDMNYEMDKNDRRENEKRDYSFDARVNRYNADPNNEDAVDPWDTLADKGGSLEDMILAEPELENPQAEQVRRVIDEKCTEAQQEFFFEHFGEGTQLEKMRRAEAKRTGKLPSATAMTNRKNRIIDKAANVLGVEPVKRHKYPKKG